MARRPEHQTSARRALSSNDPGQDRALAPDPQEPHPVGKLLPPRRSRSPNRRRYHESIDNLTPADVYFGCGPNILAEREMIKRQTIDNRRLQHRLRAA